MESEGQSRMALGFFSHFDFSGNLTQTTMELPESGIHQMKRLAIQHQGVNLSQGFTVETATCNMA